MLFSTKGIVLNKIRYSESSLIVSVLTQNEGKQSYLMKGVFSKKSKNKASCIDFLNFVDIVSWKGNSSNLYLVKEIQMAYHFKTLTSDFYKKTITLFIAELLHRCVHIPEFDIQLYSFVEESILELDNKEKQFSDFHLHFMTHFTRFLGIVPIDNYSEKNKYFDIKSAMYTPEMIDLNVGFEERSSFLLHKYLNEPFKVQSFSLIDRNEYLDDLIRFYAYHLSQFNGLKSLNVLKSVLA